MRKINQSITDTENRQNGSEAEGRGQVKQVKDFKTYRLPAIKYISYRDVQHGDSTIYLKVVSLGPTKTVGPKYSYHEKKQEVYTYLYKENNL